MRSWVVTALLSAAVPAQALEQALASVEALGVRAGVAAIEADGSFVVRHGATEAFTPASNLKLLTAAAVLAGLGNEFEFRTRFVLEDGVLVLRAGGDPNWITGSEHGADKVFGALAAALRARGVEQLRGLRIDAGPFRGPMRPSTWPADQLDSWYCAPTGPCVLDQGTFRLRIESGAGEARVSMVAPPVQVDLEGRIRMTPSNKGAVYGALDLGASVRLSGKLWQRAKPAEIRVAVRDPGPWVERALRQALVGAGIGFSAAAPAASGLVLEYKTALGPALQRMLGDSSNFDAEQCVRVLGAERAGDGSLQGGLAVVREQLAAIAGDLGGAVIVDGSGLSAANAVTPLLVLGALRSALRGPHGGDYLQALPVAGQSGTLADRFRGSPVAGRVRAKTGWIRGASALSGVLLRSDGSRCLFAILMNYGPERNGLNKELKQAQEQIVEALDARGTEPR